MSDDPKPEPSEFHRIAESLSGRVPNDPPEETTNPASDRDRRLFRLAQAGVPRRTRESLVDEPLRDTQAISAVQAFDGGMLVLSGPSGCGKTVAAAQWLEGRLRPAPLKSFATAFDLERVSRYDKGEVATLIRSHSLVLDDLGVEYLDKKGHFVSLLEGLLSARHAESRDTILTTNLDAKEFKDSYGARIAGRIREAGHFAPLRDGCLRKEKRDARSRREGA